MLFDQPHSLKKKGRGNGGVVDNVKFSFLKTKIVACVSLMQDVVDGFTANLVIQPPWIPAHDVTFFFAPLINKYRHVRGMQTLGVEAKACSIVHGRTTTL
jgi:hypothetical protein